MKAYLLMKLFSTDPSCQTEGYQLPYEYCWQFFQWSRNFHQAYWKSYISSRKIKEQKIILAEDK